MKMSAYEAFEAFPSLTALSFPAGESVVREGEAGAEVYIVGSGELEVTRRSSLGRTRRLGTLKAGDFFGEVGFLIKRGRTATVTAVGACEVYRIHASEIKAVIERRAEVRGLFENAALRRLRSVVD